MDAAVNPKKIHLPLISGKPRGVIIADACFLTALTPAIPSAYLLKHCTTVRKQPHFMDMLTYLADQGYQVIIPEMVALEIGNMFADGTKIQGIYLDQRHRDPERVLTPFFADAALPPNDPHKPKRHPNIQILPATAPPEVCHYISRLRYISKHSHNTSSASHHHSQRADFADKTIQALMYNIRLELNLRHPKNRPDVFTVSDDHKLAHKLESQGFKTLSVSKFHHMFEMAKLYESVGIRPDSDFAALESRRRTIKDGPMAREFRGHRRQQADSVFLNGLNKLASSSRSAAADPQQPPTLTIPPPGGESPSTLVMNPASERAQGFPMDTMIRRTV